MDDGRPTAKVAFSIVVPMHDEADNVQPLFEELAAALRDSAPYELIAVDDASADRTPVEIRRCAGAMSRVRLLTHAVQSGQSTAVYHGIRAAAAETVVVLDGDLQNDPADIPLLLERFASDAEPETLGLLIGHRVARRDSAVRRLSSRVANGARARLLRDATPDTGCGLKLLRRSVFVELPYFDHMHRFLPALVLQAGYRVVSVPVRHRPRLHGRSHYGTFDRLWVGLADMAGVAWLARRNARHSCTEEAL
jgi:dolichol-phosphate mannosyltransferase